MGWPWRPSGHLCKWALSGWFAPVTDIVIVATLSTLGVTWPWGCGCVGSRSPCPVLAAVGSSVAGEWGRRWGGAVTATALFLSVPVALLQRETLLRQLETNQLDIDATLEELSVQQETEDQNYGMYGSPEARREAGLAGGVPGRLQAGPAPCVGVCWRDGQHHRPSRPVGQGGCVTEASEPLPQWRWGSENRAQALRKGVRVVPASRPASRLFLSRVRS